MCITVLVATADFAAAEVCFATAAESVTSGSLRGQAWQRLSAVLLARAWCGVGPDLVQRALAAAALAAAAAAAGRRRPRVRASQGVFRCRIRACLPWFRAAEPQLN